MLRIEYADWSMAEYRAVLRALATSADAPTARRTIAAKLRYLGYRGAVRVFSSARTGLHLALSARARMFPGRTTVLVPEYACPSVVEAVARAGLCPRPLAIQDSLNLDPDIAAAQCTDEILAIVVIHTYGLPVARNDLASRAHARNILVIDDAASVVGGEHEGVLLGDWPGCVGVLSFNQSKTLTGGTPNGGGALIINDATMCSVIDEAVSRLPENTSPWLDLAYFLAEYELDRFDYSFATRLGPVGRFINRWTLRRMEVDSLLSGVHGAIVSTQITRLDEIVAGRRSAMARLVERLAGVSEISFPQYRDDQYLSRLVIRLPAGIAAATVRAEMRRYGVRTRLAYPPWWVDSAQDFPGHRILELPVSRKMRSHDMELVRSALERALRG